MLRAAVWSACSWLDTVYMSQASCVAPIVFVQSTGHELSSHDFNFNLILFFFKYE